MQAERNERKPTLLYDGDCGFCRRWVTRFDRWSRGFVVYLPYQQYHDSFEQVTRKMCEQAVQLVFPSGEVFHGAEAVLKALSYNKYFTFLHWLYRVVPGFAWMSERMYRFVATHRRHL